MNDALGGCQEQRRNAGNNRVYSRSLPGNIIEPGLPGITKQKFLRGAAIYGANASGKSNLIRALFDLQQLVRTSHQFEAGGGIPLIPFCWIRRHVKSPHSIASGLSRQA